MKVLLFIFLLFITAEGRSQYDTNHIRRVYDYMHTEEFKSILAQKSKQQTEEDIKNYKAIRKRANSYRKQQKGHVLFWTSPGKCFFPGFYSVADTSSKFIYYKGTDSVVFSRSTQINLLISYVPPNHSACAQKIMTAVQYITSDILEVHYFPDWGAAIKFGYEDILRFKVSKSGTVEFLFQHGIHHN